MPQVIGAELIKRAKPRAKPYDIRDSRLSGFLLRVLPTGNMAFYVQLGRGKRYRIGPADAVKPEAARQRAKELLGRVALGEDVMAEKREAEAPTLGSFIEEVYRTWAEGALKAPHAALRNLTRAFAEFQDKKLADITAWNIEKWRAARLKDGTRRSTVNRQVDDLKAMFVRAVEWGHLPENPLTSVKRLKQDRAAPVRFLSEDEERALLAALEARDERIKAERDSANSWRGQRGYPQMPDLRRFAFGDHLHPMVTLSMHTGMRRGEVFSLDWQDVDLDRAMLTVRGDKAKSGVTRHIPLNAVAVAALREWRRQVGGSGLVFAGRDGERLDNVRKAWGSALDAAGVKNFRWHDLRHHFASRLVMAGVDLNTVRELLGHSTITMTLRYAHLAPEHRAAAVAKLVQA